MENAQVQSGLSYHLAGEDVLAYSDHGFEGIIGRHQYDHAMLTQRLAARRLKAALERMHLSTELSTSE